MKRLASFGEILSTVRPGMLLCLLLSLTFLFNPFFVASPSSTFPAFNRPPSFRANVASSELLKFKPDLKIDALFVEETGLLALFALLSLQLNAFAPIDAAREFFAVRLVPAGNLWFRPPPVS